MPDKFDKLKYHPLVASAYNRLLALQCRNVRAYIFVATTGRSGSASLTALFGAVKGAACFHEPYPIMLNDYPPGHNRQQYFNEMFRAKKRVNVRRAARGHQCYLETNHQFIKNFMLPAASEFGTCLQVIHLVRDPVRVAASFYRIDSIPGRTNRGRLYLLDPLSRDNFILLGDLLKNCGRLDHDIYRCLWYWYEIETRIKVMKNIFSSVAWHRLETEDMNNLQAVEKLLTDIGLRYDPQRLRQLIGVRKNTKSAEKTKTVSVEEVKEKHEILKEEMTRRFGPDFWQ